MSTQAMDSVTVYDVSDSVSVNLTKTIYDFPGSETSVSEETVVTTTVTALMGITSKNVIVKSIDGKTPKTSYQNTTVTGLQFSVNKTTESDSVVVSFKATTSMTTASGYIPIVCYVPDADVTITKDFTFAITFKGDTGEKGDNGKNAGPQILRGTNVAGDISSGTWSSKTWRKASSGIAVKTNIQITDCPDASIKYGWKFETKSTLASHIAQDKVPIYEGKEYTLSCYARKSSDEVKTKLHLQWYKTSGVSLSKTYSLTTEWKLCTFTFTPTVDSPNIYFGSYNSSESTIIEGEYIEFCGMKLEPGDTATNWCEYKEDGDIYTISASMTAAYNGTISWNFYKNGELATTSYYADVYYSNAGGDWSLSALTGDFTGTKSSTYTGNKKGFAYRILVYTDSDKTNLLAEKEVSYGSVGDNAVTYEIDCPMVFKKSNTVKFDFFKVESGVRTSASVYHYAEYTTDGTNWTKFASSGKKGTSFTTTALNDSIKIRCRIYTEDSPTIGTTVPVDDEYSSLVSDGGVGDSATNVYLGNENITISCDKDGKPKDAFSTTVNVGAYVGTTRVKSVISKTSASSNITVGTITNGTASKDGTVVLSMAKTVTATAGNVVISVTANGIAFSKIINIAVSKDGQKGDTGDTGAKGAKVEREIIYAVKATSPSKPTSRVTSTTAASSSTWTKTKYNTYDVTKKYWMLVQVVTTTYSSSTDTTGTVTTTWETVTEDFEYESVHSITTADIVDDAITSAKIKNGEIVSDLIHAGAITESKVDDNAISTSKIQANAITSDKITSNAITSEKINVTAINRIDPLTSENAWCEWTEARNSIATNWYIPHENYEKGIDPVSKVNALVINKNDNAYTNYFDVEPDEILSLDFDADLSELTTTDHTLYCGMYPQSAGTTDRVFRWEQLKYENGVWSTLVAANGNLYLWNRKTHDRTHVKTYIVGYNVSLDKIPAPENTTVAVRMKNVAYVNASFPELSGKKTRARLRFVTTSGKTWASGDKMYLSNIKAESLSGGKIIAGNIIAGSITTDKLATNAVTANKIASKTITANEIASGTITADEISSKTITADKMSTGNNPNLITGGVDSFDQWDTVYFQKKSSTGSFSLYDGSKGYMTVPFCGTKALSISTGTSSSAWVVLGEKKHRINFAYKPESNYVLSVYVRRDSSISTAYTPKIYVEAYADNSTDTAGKEIAGANNWSFNDNNYHRISVSFKKSDLNGNYYIAVCVGIYTTGVIAYFDAIQLEAIEEGQEPGPFKQAGTTVIDGGSILTKTIKAESIDSGAITTDKLDVLAKNRINNFSVTGTTEGWTLSSGMVTYDSTNKRLQIVRTTASSSPLFNSNEFTVNPNEILRFDFYLETKSSPTMTNIQGLYLGLTTGDTYTEYSWDQKKGKWIEKETKSNKYFINAYNSTGKLKYTTYIIGYEADINDLPAGFNGSYNEDTGLATHTLYALKLTNGNTTTQIRTGFNNGVAGSTWYLYSPEITEINGGQIIASNIKAGSITADNIDVGDLAGDTAFLNELIVNKLRSTNYSNTPGSEAGYYMDGQVEYHYGKAVYNSDYIKNSDTNLCVALGPNSGYKTPLKGDWDSTKTYGYRDVVSYNSKYYISKKSDNLNKSPTNTGYWRLLDNEKPTDVAIGAYSLYSNLDGYMNTAVGCEALFSNTSGYSNTAVGYEALKANTSGFHNTALGSLALYQNTTGESNVAIGRDALYNNTTGSYNIAIGKSLRSNTTGHHNSSLGNMSLYSNTTGNNNCSFGFYSLNKNKTGSKNISIGNYSLQDNESGNYNVAIGYQALYSNTESKNIAIGYFASHYNTIGTENVSIGYYSLCMNTTGSNNIAIGNESGDNITSGNNNICLGYDTKLISGVMNNQFNIGNRLFYFEFRKDVHTNHNVFICLDKILASQSSSRKDVGCMGFYGSRPIDIVYRTSGSTTQIRLRGNDYDQYSINKNDDKFISDDIALFLISNNIELNNKDPEDVTEYHPYHEL